VTRGGVWVIGYIVCIFGANWALASFGLVPLGPLLVPAGSFFAGLTFGLRDLVQRDMGKSYAVFAILCGAGLTALISPQLALASGAAFLLSELLDFGIYTRLLARGWVPAVVASNVAGGLVDTALFLALAGIPLWPAVVGATIVKWAMTLPILALGAWRDARLSERMRRV
jgi:hypothetical protein